MKQLLLLLFDEESGITADGTGLGVGRGVGLGVGRGVGLGVGRSVVIT